jgi:hypothetical protein
LWEKDHRCHWCGVETILKVPHGKKHPPTFATVDHLYSRLDPRRRIPSEIGEERTVLACKRCNEDRAAREVAALATSAKRRNLAKKDLPVIEVYQQDWIPGWAAFIHDGSVKRHGTAHVVINLGAVMSSRALGKMAQTEIPYFIAESIMHEVIHALEAWAGVEFNEDRVEALLWRYRQAAIQEMKEPEGINEGNDEGR